jgi:AraC-like DNA-binding protein
MSTEEYPQIYLYRRLVQAKLFIDANYASAIDLKSIADEAAFSRFHFIRLFKKAYGKNPHQYLTTVRIHKACELLREGMPVSDVCTQVGFESVTSFSGLFKKLTGTTPSAYLMRHREMRHFVRTMPLRFIPGCFANAQIWRSGQKSNNEEVTGSSIDYSCI